MDLQLGDWIVPLFFLMTLTLLLRFRPQIVASSKESYSSITSGVAVLAFVALARVYYLNGLFSYVPFVSEPVFYRVISWIGIITGSALIVSGLSNWMPIARHHREFARARVQNLEFLRKVERLVQVEHRADRLLNLVLSCMYEHYNLRQGIVFRYSHRQHRVFLTGYVPEAVFCESALNQIRLNEAELQEYLAGSISAGHTLFEGLPDHADTADSVLPITVGGRPVGFFLLWQKQDKPLNDETLTNLRLAADIIARKVEADTLRLQNAQLEKRLTLSDRLAETLYPGTPSSRNLGSVLAVANRVVEADFLSLLAVDHKTGQMTRMTTGSSNALLVEKGLVAPTEGPVARALATGTPIVQVETEQPGESGEGGDDRVVMPSIVAVPLPIETDSSYVFLASSRYSGKLGGHTARLLQSLSPFISHMVTPAQTATESEHSERRLAAVCNLYYRYRKTGDLKSMCDDAATFLRNELNADIVRISCVDTGSPFLASQSLACSKGTSPAIPATGLMALSLLPLHCQVINSGRLLMMPGESANLVLTSGEINQCFVAGVRSLLLVPATSIAGTHAVLAMARKVKKAEPAFSKGEILLVRSVADCLAAAFLAETQGRALASHSGQNGSFSSDLELRSRMKSSLSGVIGSVELLRAQVEPGSASLDRYLSIIDKSARRLHEYLDPSELAEHDAVH